MKHTSQKKQLLLFLFSLLILTASANNGSAYYCYSSDDIAQVKKSVQTLWGQKILNQIKQDIKERRSHDLVVPVVEGGHIHHYYCDKDGQRLTFDWDKPHDHYCSACKTTYTNVNRFDWAWIYMVHRKNQEYLQACMYAYMATGDEVYAGYIKDMLLDYASKYAAYKEYNAARVISDKHSGKAFAQSLDEATWATYAFPSYTVIKKNLTQEEISRIENGLLRPCAELLLNRPAGANWQMWHNSGLAVLGVALEDDAIINVAMNDPERGYYALMKKHLKPDGWIDEGSPNYHYFPLQALIHTADVMRCRGINLYDEDMRKMYVAPIKGTYPDLSYPAHSDGWYGASVLSELPIHELAFARLKDPVIETVLEHAYGMTDRIAYETLLTGTDIKPVKEPMIQPSFCYPQSGFLCLRSGAISSVLKFGGQGIGHGHPDKLSITIHNGKKELISDFGTCAYGLKLYMDWYRNSLPHNMVTVDYKDQNRRALGKLTGYGATPDGGWAEAECTTAYPGVNMSRKLNLKGHVLEDTYTCQSDSVHVYEYVLLFNEKPVFKAGKGEPVVLNESKVHSQIKDVQKYKVGEKVSFKTPSGNLVLKLSEAANAEMLVGEAPGIPALKLAEEGTGAQPCYPVIIRFHGTKDMQINAKWTIF